MKVRLLHDDHEAGGAQLPPNGDDLKQDLELDTLLDAMAGEDAFVREHAERALLSSLDGTNEILYRQAVLRDCLEHPEVVRELYALAGEALESKRKSGHFWFRDTPERLVAMSVAVLGLLAERLRRLRRVAEEQRGAFSSEGLVELFAMLERELAEAYLAGVERQLRELEPRRGVLLGARLGRGNRGREYVLLEPTERRLRERLAPAWGSGHSFTLAARDDHGLETLARIRNSGLRLVGNALAQSTDHILGFFETLRAELAFYVGCVNLHERLEERGLATCFPAPAPPGDETFAARGLYDVALALHLASPVVGNDVDANGRRLVAITGANQGGKSTFLRSAGLAQLMMQAGMFVGADSFRANVVPAVFTHFKREEDATMTHGKLDEELARMSAIADAIRRSSLLLCNESFASTNEREGSEIAAGIVRALLGRGVKVFFVTHMFDLATRFGTDGFSQEGRALFLRAERLPDGTRTFRMVEGAPLPTSHGEDSYRRIFEERGAAAT